jgi:hypothetical protein
MSRASSAWSSRAIAECCSDLGGGRLWQVAILTQSESMFINSSISS